MQELRLVGVDGEHLQLNNEAGESFILPIDDALRTATSRAGAADERQAPSVPARKAAKPPVHLTPRDIQTRIRSGATAEQVADDSGLELRHVQRYEGPVRAERDWVAYQAQRVEVASPLPSHDGYRSAFGEESASLGDMVAYRVRSYGIDPASIEWDSWRMPDGSWHVEASFDLPEESRVDLGEQPPAWWTYNPTRKNIANGNRWAQVLSELEPLDGPLPSRRLSAVADRVFDFEAEKDDAGAPDTDTATDAASDSASDDASSSPSSSSEEQDGLLDVLRSRRGQRIGADEDGDDALAVMLTRGAIPAAHPRDDGDGHDGQDEEMPGLSLAPDAGEDSEGETAGIGSRASDLDPGDQDAEASALNDDGTPRLYNDISARTREVSVFAHPSSGKAKGSRGSTGSRNEAKPKTAAKADPSDTEDGTDAAAERRAKPKRSSVPSWDDIVFGRRSD